MIAARCGGRRAFSDGIVAGSRRSRAVGAVVRCKAIPTVRITQGGFGDECAPFAELPAWWSGFLFHVLTTRQVSLYLYLSMLLGGDVAAWYPTTKEIGEDLGLASVAVVFAAMKELVDNGFIARQRRARTGRRGRHNVYMRPSCEFTIYRLLTNRRIDAMLRAQPGVDNRMSPEARALRDEWLRGVLEQRFDRYAAVEMSEKRRLLLEALEQYLEEHRDPALHGETESRAD